jgi:hypothetical protein
VDDGPLSGGPALPDLCFVFVSLRPNHTHTVVSLPERDEVSRKPLSGQASKGGSLVGKDTNHGAERRLPVQPDIGHVGCPLCAPAPAGLLGPALSIESSGRQVELRMHHISSVSEYVQQQLLRRSSFPLKGAPRKLGFLVGNDVRQLVGKTETSICHNPCHTRSALYRERCLKSKPEPCTSN